MAQYDGSIRINTLLNTRDFETSFRRLGTSIRGLLGSLGLGLGIETPSLGILLRNARNYFLDRPYLLIFPAVIVSLITVTFYLVGNAFSDAADPRNHV